MEQSSAISLSILASSKKSKRGLKRRLPRVDPFCVSVWWQYVGVFAKSGRIADVVWHVRKAPTNWTRDPPFHMRIVRPTPAGILHYMLTCGKCQIQKVVSVYTVNYLLIFCAELLVVFHDLILLFRTV